MTVRVVSANGRPLTSEEQRAAERAAGAAVDRVRAMNTQMCERCAADVEAVIAAGRTVLVDRAPVVRASLMDGLVLWPNPATRAVEHLRAGAGQAIHREHRCDSELRVTEQSIATGKVAERSASR